MSARTTLIGYFRRKLHPVDPSDKADALLSAFRAAGYVIERDWQDISTAPRDGTPVLLIARYPDGVTWSDQYQSWWSDGRWARWPHAFAPGYWRPLPAPPAGEVK